MHWGGDRDSQGPVHLSQAPWVLVELWHLSPANPCHCGAEDRAAFSTWETSVVLPQRVWVSPAFSFQDVSSGKPWGWPVLLEWKCSGLQVR